MAKPGEPRFQLGPDSVGAWYGDASSSYEMVLQVVAFILPNQIYNIILGGSSHLVSEL